MINLFDLWVSKGTPGLPEDSDSFDETMQAFKEFVLKVKMFFGHFDVVQRPKLTVVHDRLLENVLTEEQAETFLTRTKMFNKPKIQQEIKKQPKKNPVSKPEPSIVEILSKKAESVTKGGTYFTNRTEEINKRAEEIRGRTIPLYSTCVVQQLEASPELTDDELETVIDIMEDCPGLVFKPRQRVSYSVEKRLI